MHLKIVELFCDVAQRRSFSKGAAAHEVSQSSASQAVSLLEKRLGTKLLDRSKRPLELTPAGRVYYDGCRELLDRYRALEDQILHLQDRVVGSVRVAAIYSVGLMQMESYVHRFEILYPDVHLRLEYLHPDAVYEQVLNDEADIGLVSYPRHGGEFVSLDWQEQAMVLVVPPRHRLAGYDVVSPHDLENEDYVGFTQELTIRREVDRWLRRKGVAVNVVREFDNIETIKRAIEVGSGVALLPQPTVWQETAAGTLAAIPLRPPELYRPLGIVQKRHKRLATAARKFIELLQQNPATFPPVQSRRRNQMAGVPASANGPRDLTVAGKEALAGGRKQKTKRM